jgi:hypothetical protein
MLFSQHRLERLGLLFRAVGGAWRCNWLERVEVRNAKLSATVNIAV